MASDLARGINVLLVLRVQRLKRTCVGLFHVSAAGLLVPLGILKILCAL